MMFFKKCQYLRHSLQLNSFSKFKGRRPIKIRKKLIAVNPNIKTYRFMSNSTPVSSGRTVPLIHVNENNGVLDVQVVDNNNHIINNCNYTIITKIVCRMSRWWWSITVTLLLTTVIILLITPTVCRMSRWSDSTSRQLTTCPEISTGSHSTPATKMEPDRNL